MFLMLAVRSNYVQTVPLRTKRTSLNLLCCVKYEMEGQK